MSRKSGVQAGVMYTYMLVNILLWYVGLANCDNSIRSIIFWGGTS